MLNTSLNPYASYDAQQWPRPMDESHGRHSGRTCAKYIVYIFTLYVSCIVSKLDALVQIILNSIGIRYESRWKWWNVIKINGQAGPILYLGALPLTQTILGKTIRDDGQELKLLGIKAVLTVTEPFENHDSRCLLPPVTPEQWRNKNIVHLQISTPDFRTIAFEKIHRGVEFIHENRQRGNYVYVHCKAGRARSVLIVLCYLMKHQHMNAEQALQTLTEHRRQVLLEGGKWATVKAYERWIRLNNY